MWENRVKQNGPQVSEDTTKAFRFEEIGLFKSTKVKLPANVSFNYSIPVFGICIYRYWRCCVTYISTHLGPCGNLQISSDISLAYVNLMLVNIV